MGWLMDVVGEKESGRERVKRDPEARKQVRDGNPMEMEGSYRTAGRRARRKGIISSPEITSLSRSSLMLNVCFNVRLVRLG